MFCVQASHPEDLYGDLLTAYALALAGEDREARWRMRQLLKASNRSYQTLWWEQLGKFLFVSVRTLKFLFLILLFLGHNNRKC